MLPFSILGNRRIQLMDKEEQKKERQYYCGVFVERDLLVGFVKRNQNNIPSSALFVTKYKGTGINAERLARKDLLFYYNACQKEQQEYYDKTLIKAFHKAKRIVPVYVTPLVNKEELNDDILPGTVCTLDDGDTHIGIALKNIKNMTVAALFTTNPNWANQVREATKDELALAGFPTRRKTYLAAACRPTAYFISRRITFPEHITQNLISEFCYGGV